MRKKTASQQRTNTAILTTVGPDDEYHKLAEHINQLGARCLARESVLQSHKKPGGSIRDPTNKETCGCHGLTHDHKRRT